MERQSWHFFWNPGGEPILHVRPVRFIKGTALSIFLGKWVTGMVLFCLFVYLIKKKVIEEQVSKALPLLGWHQCKERGQLDADTNRLDQWRAQYNAPWSSFEMLIPSCLNLVAWFFFELSNKCMAVGKVWRKHKSSHHLNCSSAVVEPMASGGAAWWMALGTKRGKLAFSCAPNKSNAALECWCNIKKKLNNSRAQRV